MIKLEKRVKNIIRFKTSVGNITLKDAITELTNEEFEAVKNHPSFSAYAKTSGIRIASEKIVSAPKAPKKVSDEDNSDEDNSDEDNSDGESSDEDSIDPNKFNKDELVKMATELEIEVGEMTKKELAEAINAATVVA